MSSYDALLKEIGELRREVTEAKRDASRAREVATSVARRGRVQLIATEHEDAWRRLAPDTGLLRWRPRGADEPETPDLSGSLVARLRQGDPVSGTMGNVHTGGMVNMLANPLMESLKTGQATSTWTSWGSGWWARHKVNSGAGTPAPYVRPAYNLYDPGNNPFNTTLMEIASSSISNTDFTAQLENGPLWPGFGETTSFPFLAASVALNRYGDGPHTAGLTRLEAWVEIVDDTGGAEGTVMASSPVYNMLEYAGTYQTIRASAVLEEPNDGWWAHQWILRVSVRFGFTTGEPSLPGVVLGEPQLAYSASQSAPPFGPLVGMYRTGTLGAYASGASEPSVFVDSGGIRFGDGVATLDTSLVRNAAGVLAIGTTGSADQGLIIGDDAALFDVDTADRLGIKGQQTAANGGFVFGSGKDTNLYRSAANTLKTDDTLLVGSGTPTNIRGVVALTFVYNGTMSGSGTFDINLGDTAASVGTTRLPFDAEVVGISATLLTARTAGTLTAQAYNASSAALVGPTVVLDGTVTNLRVTTDTVTGTPDVAGGAQIRCRITTSGFTPVANGLVVVIYLAMYAE